MFEIRGTVTTAVCYAKVIDEKAAEQIRTIRDEVAKETGVPSNLLTADTKEGCEEQAKAIKAYTESNRPGYPSVRDSGEATTSTKGTTKEQFEDWVKNLG